MAPSSKARISAETMDAVRRPLLADGIAVPEVVGVLRGRREAMRGDQRSVEIVEGVLSELAEGEAKAAAGETLADLLGRLSPPRPGAPDA